MGHGRVFDSSGTSTPRDDETLVSTPPSEPASAEGESTVQNSRASLEDKVTAKLTNDGKRTYGKATLAEVGKQLKKSTTKEEHTERGRVKWSVYSAYMKAASRPGFVLFVTAILVTQSAQLLSNVTLKQWADHNAQEHENTDKWFYLGVYGGFNLLQIFSAMTGFLTIFILLGLRSAKHLHNAV